jgi:hypothetical protein
MAEAAPARPLLLCADDFGQSAGIDQAIVALVQAGRLGAFSCLSNGAAWPQDAAQVVALRRQAQAGLHFNLTEGRPLSPALAAVWPQLPALPRLIAAAHLGRLPLAAVGEELAAQWQAFVDASGVAPDFIDGHQHVHHLPGVRGLVLALAQTKRLPVRSTGRLAGPGPAVKRWLIAATGGRALARALARAGLPHNRLLLGAYDFVEPDYGRLMRGWLARVPAGGALLFCHPGRPAPGDGADAIAAARQREFAYLASDAFPRDLQAAGVVLAPVWR